MDDAAAKPGRDYTWPVCLAVFAFVWIVGMWMVTPKPPDAFAGERVGSPAPYDWKLQDLEGKTVDFGAYRGRTVFLNVWATWCPPCIQEMPSIARLAANPRLKQKDVAFVCVATDDNIESVRRFVAAEKWPMTVLHAAALPGAFLTEGIPATFILSPDGRIAGSMLGGYEWDGPEVLEKLEKLAAPARKG